MGRIWSEQRRYETWLQVEVAAAEAMAAAGIVPAEAARDLRDKGAFDIARIDEDREGHAARRDRVHHVGGREGRAVGPLAALRPHLVRRRRHRAGAADGRGVRPDRWRTCAALAEAIRVRAIEHRRTPMIGRTHGVHAEPMTFGLKLALWYAETEREHRARAPRARGHARRQDLGRGRHLRAPRPVDRSRRLPRGWGSSRRRFRRR